MSNIGEKFLPLGSVITISENSRKIMITGFYKKNDLDQLYYDYSGCMYPEGILDGAKDILFNHDQITSILYNGMINDEEIAYKTQLKAFIANMELQNSNQSVVTNQEQINTSNASDMNNNQNSGIAVLDINNIDLTTPATVEPTAPTIENDVEDQQPESNNGEPKYVFGPDGTVIAVE